MKFEDDPNKVINYLIGLTLKGNYVFRGYNTQDQMLPGLVRNRTSQYEKEYINKFLKYGSRFFKADSAIELLSNAQHYGLHTRLLDFTYNPLIALSFALYNRKTQQEKEAGDRDYYYIRHTDLNKQIYLSDIPKNVEFRFGGFINDSVNIKLFAKLIALEKVFMDDSSLEKAFMGDLSVSTNRGEYVEGLKTCIIDEYNCEDIKNKIENKTLIFIDPNLSNDRVVMQQGLFMIPYTLNEELYVDMIKNNTTEIKIHKDLRDDLIKILDKLGYNAYRLMPDLASVCQEIIRSTV